MSVLSSLNARIAQAAAVELCVLQTRELSAPRGAFAGAAAPRAAAFVCEAQAVEVPVQRRLGACICIPRRRCCCHLLREPSQRVHVTDTSSVYWIERLLS